MNFEEMVGITLAKIEGGEGGEEIRFTSTDGRVFRQHHYQDCCESVEVDEIHGDLDDLIGSPILLAEEAIYDNEPSPDGKTPEYPDSYSWTFYKMATAKGHVTIKWLGESNGYYSETVYFEEIERT